MHSSIGLYFILCLATNQLLQARCSRQQDALECIEGSSIRYIGTRNTTASGRTCQRWDAEKPYKPAYTPQDGANHNYCRNPDQDSLGTWCYTTDIAMKWEYCNITKCADNSTLVWTSYLSRKQETSIFSLPADPEVVRRVSDSSNNFNSTTIVRSNETQSEYWALTVHNYKRNLYYTNYKAQYLGVWDMNTEKETRHFEGMTHGIENLAIDLKTDNLYWTDSTFKWVMVANKELTHYKPIYRASPNPPYAIAVHSVKRYLIFSIYKSSGTRIVRTDLAGKSAVDLVVYPHVFDVTGITIDNEDDRIYLGDFNGLGSTIVSYRIDGTDRKRHAHMPGSIIWNVVTYQDYIYSSDVREKEEATGENYYNIWVTYKSYDTKIRYRFQGKPRGIVILRDIDESSVNDGPSSKCGGDNDCDQICLPSTNATRLCDCSLGYHLGSDGKQCNYNHRNDSYLIVSDSGQGRLYQFPLATADKGNDIVEYNIIPLDRESRADAVALDVRQGFIYWLDRKTSSINRATLDGKNQLKVADVRGNIAYSIAVDPQTGHLFYADRQTATITVLKDDGSYNKTINATTLPANGASDIKMLAVDIKYKYIYWTDTFKKSDAGKAMRCRFDGSQTEVVISGLGRPHAITIDYERHRLYVADTASSTIYETELSAIETIRSTSTRSSHLQRLSLEPSQYIMGMAVQDGILYIADGKYAALRIYNISSKNMTEFGPQEFVTLSTLSAFQSSFYANYIESVSNPCSGSRCRGLCLALNATTSECYCDDGKTGLECVEKATMATPTSAAVLSETTGTTRTTESFVRSTFASSTESTENEMKDSILVDGILANILRIISFCRSQPSLCIQ